MKKNAEDRNAQGNMKELILFKRDLIKCIAEAKQIKNQHFYANRTFLRICGLIMV